MPTRPANTKQGRRLFLLLLTSAAAVAANSCCEIDPSSVSSGTSKDWCLAEINTCSTLCGSSVDINTCDATTFEYSCTCSSQLSPNVSDYANSLPSLECNQWIADCLSNASDNAAAETTCTEVVCGNKSATAIQTKSSSPSTLLVTSVVSVSSTRQAGDTSSTVVVIVTTNLSSATSLSSSSITPSRNTGTSSSAVAKTSASTTTNGNSSVTGTTNAQSSRKESLSAGAKAGIAIGAVLGAIFVIALLILCSRKRSGKKSRPGGFWYHRSAVSGALPELETKEKPGELWGNKVFHTTNRELADNQIFQAPDDAPGGPKSADEVAIRAVGGTHVNPSQASFRQNPPTRSELPADTAAAERRSLGDQAQPQKPNPPSHSPFSGAGPVPTHLTECEPSVEDKPASAAAANSMAEIPARASPNSSTMKNAAVSPPLASNGVEDELTRLKLELEQVRKERDRLQLMQSLSSREEELRRAIEMREMD